MSNVLKLVEYSCRDTISILKALLALALRGKLRGLIVHYRTDDGEEDTVFTGLYKQDSHSAMGAILTTSMMQLRANGEID